MATFPVAFVALQIDGSSAGAGKALGGAGVAANVVDVRISGAWAARCSGIAEGDEVSITGFDVTRASD
jgi:N-methylhydantoinase B/oxoprolinase/acetone carboxylase alpha subunit